MAIFLWMLLSVFYEEVAKTKKDKVRQYGYHFMVMKKCIKIKVGREIPRRKFY